ncbi:MAG: hypothetical protein AUK07_01460 [Parcubacteria group bacterium CG2_30_36_21]|nr:MAG: hypothetical protein AUK07_01460 [Parcubacteria group bacterium CG2_30_36_21]
MQDYLEISRASDIPNPRERIIYRILEILPGFLSLITLSFALFFSWLRPVWVAIFIILFDLYWTLKVFYLSSHQIVSFRRMRKYLKTDWQEKLKDFPKCKDIYQLVILPMAKENWEVVEETLESLKNCVYPKDKMIIVLAQEESGGEAAEKIGELAQEHYGKCFHRFLVTVHPENLEGEVRGKGSNMAFAGKEIRKTIEKEKIPLKSIIVSAFDIDTKVFPQYFLCLTYHYLTAQNPERSSFQPIPLYHNNIWQSPALTRVVAASNSFWQMMQQEKPEQLVTYSSHSMPAAVFFGVGYPSNVVSDDSRIFWKSFLKFDGDYQVVPLYYPVSMDVVVGKSFGRTILNQYKQQKRWAWGCIEIPYIIFGFLKNKKIPLGRKIFHSLVLLDGFWSWACASLLIFFLGWLPLLLGGEEFNISLLSYNLPRLTGFILTFSMIGMITGALINICFIPPRPKKMSWLKNLSMILQWFLLPFTLIIFGAFPALDAQIRLILGKHLEFWNTPKPRKNYSR